MNMLKKVIIGAAAAVSALTAAVGISAAAEWDKIGLMGDLNNDGKVTVADLVVLSKHLLGSEPLTNNNSYFLAGDKTKIVYKSKYGSTEYTLTGYSYLETADINFDDKVDAFDFVLLRKQIIDPNYDVLVESDDPTTTPANPVTTTKKTTAVTTKATTTATAAKVTTTAPPVTTAAELSAKDAPIYDLYGSMPSIGEAKAVVFYVDFPDCRYSYEPSVEEIEKAMFGKENESDSNYPYESMAAYYTRASRGKMKMSGEVYRYTAKNNKAYYEDDVWHIEIIDEIFSEMDAKVDFSKFDGDKDGIIDSLIVSVPENAGRDNWWPTAGVFGGNRNNKADGMTVGHVIVGNAEIVDSSDHEDFVSSYCHEMGHCMGLCDYYFTYKEDFQGMHGSGGFELMDDAIGDFGCASKLMLGWYDEDQINIFDKSVSSATYTLASSQTDEGSCIIIPCGDLNGKYRSEFFIIEYTTIERNNTELKKIWWRATGEGIRIYHIEATEDGSYWNSWKYAVKHKEDTEYGEGRRFIRLVGEGDDDTDNLYRTGNVIDGTNSDFRQYDSSNRATVDMGITITVGELTANGYEVTLKVN